MQAKMKPVGEVENSRLAGITISMVLNAAAPPGDGWLQSMQTFPAGCRASTVGEWVPEKGQRLMARGILGLRKFFSGKRLAMDCGR